MTEPARRFLILVVAAVIMTWAPLAAFSSIRAPPRTARSIEPAGDLGDIFPIDRQSLGSILGRRPRVPGAIP